MNKIEIIEHLEYCSIDCVKNSLDKYFKNYNYDTYRFEIEKVLKG